MDDHDVDPEICPVCGNVREFEDCYECAGEGFTDDYEEDPINAVPGEFSVCSVCRGQGGWWVCWLCAKKRMKG